MYTYKLEQAIRAVSILHEDQLRRGAVPVPFVSHVFAVMTILRDYTTDEDTLVAALLHDTLEDTDYTPEEMQADFGGPVTELVLTVTEPKTDTKDRKLSWKERKQAYIKQIKKGAESALLICAADKIHNFRCIVEEYHEHHNRFIQDFGPNLEDRLEVYQNISNVINSRLKSDIVHEFNSTFTEFKNFITNVQDSNNQLN
jgi:(p)ppGpp synthase/HD superfamily hydrolase